MNHFLRLELSRYVRVIPRFGATVACSTLMGLYFFTFVGRFDDSSDSAMLREPAAVITLALTVAFCVVVIRDGCLPAFHCLGLHWQPTDPAVLIPRRA